MADFYIQLDFMKTLLLSLLTSCQLIAFSQRLDTTTVYTESPVTLNTATGKLLGTMVRPRKEKNEIALLIAGSGPTDRNGNNPFMKNNSLQMIAAALADSGIASVRYDKRGIAASTPAGPNESDLRFSMYVEDAKAWINWIRKTCPGYRITIIGHSEGSLVGMMASNEADRFISISGSGRPAGEILSEQLVTQYPQQKEYIASTIDSLNRQLTVQKVNPLFFAIFRPTLQPYLMSWFQNDPQQLIAALHMPILIVQGDMDVQVKVKDAEQLKAAQPNARLVIIPHMNHVLKEVEDDYAANIKSYSDPKLPLASHLMTKITSFILAQ